MATKQREAKPKTTRMKKPVVTDKTIVALKKGATQVMTHIKGLLESRPDVKEKIIGIAQAKRVRFLDLAHLNYHIDSTTQRRVVLGVDELANVRLIDSKFVNSGMNHYVEKETDDLQVYQLDDLLNAEACPHYDNEKGDQLVSEMKKITTHTPETFLSHAQKRDYLHN